MSEIYLLAIYMVIEVVVGFDVPVHISPLIGIQKFLQESLPTKR